MAQGAGGQIVPNASARGWRVVSQEQVTDLDPRGRPVLGMRIHFTTASNVNGSVFLSMQDYNQDNVRAAIAAQAGLIDSVHQLKG